MNRLQLCQRAITECAASGTPLATTINQVGEQARFVGWLDQAWSELQTEHDNWGFMRSSNLLGAGMSFVTVAGQAAYPLGSGAGTCGVPVANFGKWDRESFRNYTTAAGFQNEMLLDDIPYDVWRDSYMLGAMRAVQTRPVAVAIGPNQSVCLGPPPNGNYTVTGDFFMAPTVMAADTDVPAGLPVQFHMLLIYKAMQFYGSYEAAPEVFQRGTAGWSLLLAELEAIYLPEVTFAGALA